METVVERDGHCARHVVVARAAHRAVQHASPCRHRSSRWRLRSEPRASASAGRRTSETTHLVAGDPVRHQVIRVHRSYTRGEVPTDAGAVRRSKGIAGGGEPASGGYHGVTAPGGRGRGTEAVLVSGAIDGIVALRDVVENAAAVHGTSVARVTNGRTGGAIFIGGKLVVDVVGIALRAACVLVDEGLNAGHDGRGEGRSAGARPRARITRAAGSAVAHVGPAHHVVVAPQAIASEKGDVGQIANAVVGNARYGGLPVRFGIAPARAAYYTGGGGRAGGAAAGTSTAAGHRLQAVLVRRIAGAEAGCAVTDGIAEVTGQKRAGAGVIPGNFGDIRYRRAISGGVGRAPIGAIGVSNRVAEISAAHGDIIGCGGKGTDSDSVGCPAGAGIATGCVFNTRRHEDRDALRDRLLEGGVIGGVGRRAVPGFAFAKADAHDGGRAGGRVQQILHGDQSAKGGPRAGTSGHHDGGGGCGGTCPFGVQDGFTVVTGHHAGGQAIVGAAGRSRVNRGERAGSVLRKAERGAEGVPIGSAVEIAVFQHRDGLALSGGAGGE